MKTLSIGSAMIDTIAIISSDRIERMSMVNAERAFLLMEEGAKTEAEAISTHLGGGAVNTAISFARQGCDAAILAKLGSDPRGDNVVAGLEKAGVATTHIVRDKTAPTGASVLVSSHDRNAAIFTYRGANTRLVAADLIDGAFAVDLVHIGSLSNESAALFPTIIDKAKAAGATVSANPGMRQLTSRAQDFLRVLSKLDLLMINRVEAEALMPALVPNAGEGGPLLSPVNGKLPALAARGLIGGGFEMSLGRFFSALADISDATIILTDGGDGAYIGRRGRLHHSPVVTAEIAGTAGAGDAFASTFANHIVSGTTLKDAAIAAAANAASVISFVDTQTGLLDKIELQNRAKKAAKAHEIIAWNI